MEDQIRIFDACLGDYAWYDMENAYDEYCKLLRGLTEGLNGEGLSDAFRLYDLEMFLFAIATEIAESVGLELTNPSD